MHGEPEFEKIGKKKRMIWELVVLCTFSFSLTVLYLAMRIVMYNGGYISLGGPYLVTHQAPGWTWIMPFVILLNILSMSAGFAIVKRKEGFSLMVFSWSALCTSLGWIFLDFGLGLHGNPGLQWDEIVVGIVIILIGVLPLMVMLLDVRQKMRERRYMKTVPVMSVNVLSVLIQVMLSVMALCLGILFFWSLQ
jgi:hypothetical protein